MLYAMLRHPFIHFVLVLALLNLPHAIGSTTHPRSDGHEASAVYLPLVSFPTHNRLSFADSVELDSEIWAHLIDANGAHQQQLPLQIVSPTSASPTWSYDGKQIALFHVSTQAGPVPSQQYSLATVAVATNQIVMQATLTDTQLLSVPIWSPTANNIAFRAAHGLYLLRENMTQPEVISTTTEPYDPEAAFDPVWSPDGRWLLQNRCVVRVERPYATSCVPNQDGITVERLKWAPNSQQVAIETWEDSKDVLRVADVTDLAHHRVVIPGSSGFNWLWSPDSRMIVTTADTGDGRRQLFLVPLDGTAWRQVPLARPIGNLLAWSPDGAQIVYTQPNNTDGSTTLVFIRPDGTVLSTVPLPRIYDFPQAYSVVWSADSAALALIQSEASRGCPDGGICREFEVIRPDGTVLSPIRFTRTIPKWSPN